MTDPGMSLERLRPDETETAGRDPVAGALERALLDLTPGRTGARRALLRLVTRLGLRFTPAHERRVWRALRLAKVVELNHGAEPECPRGVSGHLVLLGRSLSAHRRREDQVLAEAMGGAGRAATPGLADLRADHAAIDQHLIRLAVLTRDFTPPLGADRDWRALSRVCRDLDRDLREHMRLEGDVVFPCLDDAEGTVASVGPPLVRETER